MSIRREQGFTLIELLVVSVIVGILATLVAMTYSGVQAKNRNSNRQADIDLVQGKLEAYYVEKSKYPSLTELNDAGWRAQNLKNFSNDILNDPQWNDKAKTCTGTDGQPAFAPAPAGKCYSYQVTAADGSACGATVACVQYSLTATFEGGEKYVKTSLN